ncbi:MAG: PAS domain-containing protein [Acidobacteriota bacterium]
MDGFETPRFLSEVERLFQQAPCFMTVQDREGRILAANQNFQTTFGAGVGSTCYRAYKRRTTPCPHCPVVQTFEDRKCHTSHQEVILGDGTPLPILVYTSPLLGPEGEVEAVVEISADISPVKALEEKLRESRERFRALFEEVPCYLTVQDQDLRILQCNRSFREDFGDYIGAYCYEVYKHRGEPCLNCPVARTFSDGRVHHSEETVFARDGRRLQTLVSTAPLRNRAGEVEAVMEMSANITEIRQLQDRLANLGLLAGTLSHGLKGLLMGLDGGSYLLQTGIERGSPERVAEGWRILQRNVAEIRGVVHDFLYLAKEREPCWEMLDLRDLARSAMDLVRSRAASAQVELRAELQEAIEGEVDRASMQASLVNLLENALDACRLAGKGTHRRVRLSLAREDGYARFQIEDNGVGMEEETLAKLFAPFFSTKGCEGTGLGLYVARKVAEQHGGTLEALSAPGKGSRFTLRVPLHAGRKNA